MLRVFHRGRWDKDGGVKGEEAEREKAREGELQQLYTLYLASSKLIVHMH